MPQTTPENNFYVRSLLEPLYPMVYENWGLDLCAETFLKERGIYIRNGMITLEQRWSEYSEDERQCIDYLCDEWDYGVRNIG